MRRLLQALLLLSLSTIITLSVLEAFTRWRLGTPWPEKFPLARVRPDPKAGYIMVPGDVHYTYDKLVRLNTSGFRGPEVIEKREHEYRIIALGDSHIYGQGVQDDSLITTIMQNRLNDLGHNCFYNVINMGVRAYSINNELALLNDRGVPLRPDHVVLFFYINDFPIASDNGCWTVSR